MIRARIELDFEETDNPSAEMVMEYLTALHENDELFIEWLRPQGSSAMTRKEFDDIIQHYRDGFDDGFRRMGQTKDGRVAPVTSTNLYHRLAYLQGCGHGLNVNAETQFGGAEK